MKGNRWKKTTNVFVQFFPSKDAVCLSLLPAPTCIVLSSHSLQGLTRESLEAGGNLSQTGWAAGWVAGRSV